MPLPKAGGGKADVQLSAPSGIDCNGISRGAVSEYRGNVLTERLNSVSWAEGNVVDTALHRGCLCAEIRS